MKFGFLKDKKYDSDYFLKLAIMTRHNSLVLKDKALHIFKDDENSKHGLFLRYTAFEELQKALFCMLVHRKFVYIEKILPVFSDHKAKIILFEKIFNSKKGLSIHNNELIVDGMPLKELDFEDIFKEFENFSKEYMAKRNDCLYIRPTESGYYSPNFKENISKERERLNDESTALNFLFNVLWKYDFKGIVDGFEYYKLTPKDQPEKHNITFAGGELIERKDYRPSWVDGLLKELEE
ncbi:MAG: AbiV family abortive infection protein [Nitrosarchaeum sp.]|nr:AbiV family abortive infection protein [Nitrosarchaeum sp.]